MKIRAAAALFVAVIIAGASCTSAQVTPPRPIQDPDVLRFARRALPYYPSSSFVITSDLAQHTPSGRYRVIEIERSCESRLLSGTLGLVLDEASGSAWFGFSGKLPIKEMEVDLSQLRPFLEGYLPQMLGKALRKTVVIDWDSPSPRAGALIPFNLRVKTGYGDYLQPVAVSSDGGYFVMGTNLPFDQDPVLYRRQLLLSSADVVWDQGSETSTVEIVEFSDFECPGCRHKWPLIKSVLDGHGDTVRHGFVAFPLTSIHPWAFRSASAGWCVARDAPQLLVPFKELFYSLQRDMEVSLVTDTALDFISANGLNEDEFLACYLRQPSLDGVHSALALGNGMGVMATPTYFVNGWQVQVPNKEWFEPMIKHLLAGQEP